MQIIGDKALVYSEAVFIESNCSWFCDYDSSTIYKSTPEGLTEVVVEINNQIKNTRPYGAIVKYEDQLIISPLSAEKFFCVDIETKEVKTICLSGEYINKKLKSCSLFLLDELLFVVFINSPMVAVYNLRTHLCEYYTVPDSILKIIDYGLPYFCLYSKMDNNEIIIPLYSGKGVIIFNLFTRKFTHIEMKIDSSSISSAVKLDDERFVLTNRFENSVYINNGESTNKIILGNSIGYRNIWVDNGEIFLLREKYRDVFRLDIEEEKVIVCNAKCNLHNKNSPIISIAVDSDKIIEMAKNSLLHNDIEIEGNNTYLNMFIRCI